MFTGNLYFEQNILHLLSKLQILKNPFIKPVTCTHKEQTGKEKASGRASCLFYGWVYMGRAVKLGLCLHLQNPWTRIANDATVNLIGWKKVSCNRKIGFSVLNVSIKFWIILKCQGTICMCFYLLVLQYSILMSGMGTESGRVSCEEGYEVIWSSGGIHFQ